MIGEVTPASELSMIERGRTRPNIVPEEHLMPPGTYPQAGLL